MRTLTLTACCVLLAACPEKTSTPPSGPPDATAAPAETAPVTLTLLFTGSENGYLLPTADDQGVKHGGAAETLGAWMKNEGHCAGALGPKGEAACKDGSTVVLSTGDNANGAAISSVFHGEPTAELMHHMGYAASAFGNHEVDFGRPQFARNRELGGFPYLAANLPASADADSEAPVALASSRIVSRKGVDVAVVGLTSRKTPSTTMPGRLDGLTLKDDEQALAEELPKVQKAAALVLVTDGCLNELAPLLEKHADWKVSVAAGRQCEDAFPPTAGGAKLVYAGRHFNQYGRAKLTLKGGKVAEVETSVVEVKSGEGAAEAEPKAKELVEGWKKKLDDSLGKQIGFSEKGIEQTSPQMMKWMGTALKEKFNADVGLVNFKAVRQNLPKGPVTMASVYDLIPFENSVVVMNVPGEVLKTELKNEAARFVGPAVNAIDPKKTYKVATNNFVFFGGDGFGFNKVDTKPDFTGVPWQTAVIEWTEKLGSTEKKPLESLLK
jgi:2',3'-cyclic-nucleotide 2'-phosphodiesterase (5'-nucleotidase family)